MIEALLYLLPLIGLLVPLLRGRFLGERAIASLRGRLSADRRQRPARSIGGTRRAPRLFPRGSSLLASSLAVRPPPHHALT